jgi:hypothetical protein
MANVTVAIPAELKAKMRKFPEINWSEVARQAIAEKTRTLELMHELLARSVLTEADALAAGRQIKRRVLRKHRRPA